MKSQQRWSVYLLIFLSVILIYLIYIYICIYLTFIKLLISWDSYKITSYCCLHSVACLCNHQGVVVEADVGVEQRASFRTRIDSTSISKYSFGYLSLQCYYYFFNYNIINICNAKCPTWCILMNDGCLVYDLPSAQSTK